MSGAITATVTTTSTSCGYSTGSIIVAASGGNAPYILSHAVFMGIPFTKTPVTFKTCRQDAYQVIVTDADSLSDTTIVTIVNNPPPSCIISGYQYPSTCSSFDGALTVTASNGTPPISIQPG